MAMNVMKFSLFFVFTLSLLGVKAQETGANSSYSSGDIFSALQDKSYGGKIQLYQNPSLQVLIEKSNRINKTSGVNGFRIQLFSGSNITAREKSGTVGQSFIEKFPELAQEQVYYEYQAPYFKVLVGDYRNENEAVEVFYKIKKQFPGSYIVRTVINYPKL